jgi:hypothetical protein
MKAVLIDTNSKEVKYVNLKNENGSYLKSIYDKLGCKIVEGINLDEKHTLYINEEGLLNIKDDTGVFMFNGINQPLVGNGLIIAYDNESNKVPVNLELEEIAEKILFTDIFTIKNNYIK